MGGGLGIVACAAGFRICKVWSFEHRKAFAILQELGSAARGDKWWPSHLYQNGLLRGST